MPDPSALRVAAVGLGWVTVNRHIPALRRSKRAQIVGVIDHQSERAEATRQRFGLPFAACADTATEVSWLDRVDAVIIGTPPQTHFALARSYLGAGKHVLVEKPMAMTVREAQELDALAVDLNLVLAVVHNFQFARSVQRVKKMMETERLGRVRSIWAVQLSNPRRRLPMWYEDLPLGLFYDESPHFFYLLRYLTGGELTFRTIDVVRAIDGTQTPTMIGARLDAAGMPIKIDMSFDAPISEWHIGVLGTRRAAFVDMFRDVLVVVPNDQSHLGRHILRTSATAGWSHTAGTMKSGLLLAAGKLSYGNDEVIGRFCAACRGDTDALRGITAKDGIAVVRMQHQVIDASK